MTIVTKWEDINQWLNSPLLRKENYISYRKCIATKKQKNKPDHLAYGLCTMLAVDDGKLKI